MSIVLLQKLLPPPTSPTEIPSDKDWIETERRLGTTLPNDYRTFISLYGNGRIGRFLSVYNPIAENQHLNLYSRLEFERKQLDYSVNVMQMPPMFAVFPPPPGLIPCAGTDNGDTLYWITEGVTPSDWPIGLVYSREVEVHRFDMILTEFLARTLNGMIAPFDDNLGPDECFFEVRRKRSQS